MNHKSFEIGDVIDYDMTTLPSPKEEIERKYGKGPFEILEKDSRGCLLRSLKTGQESRFNHPHYWARRETFLSAVHKAIQDAENR